VPRVRFDVLSSSDIPWNHDTATVCVTQEESKVVEAYTDGSTPVDLQDRRDNPLSGFAVVFPGASVHDCRVYRAPAACSGDNYAAEAMAILAAIVLTPGQDDLVIVTDSLSCIFACNHGRQIMWEKTLHSQHDRRLHGHSFSITQRKRILTSARSIMSTIRALIEMRPGSTAFRHQRAHTIDNLAAGSGSFSARMNLRADAEAKLARSEARGLLVPPHTYMEERVVVHDKQNWPVLGDHRTQLARTNFKLHLEPNATALRSQGELLRSKKSGVRALLAGAQHSQSSALTKHTILAISNCLPTELNALKHSHTPRSTTCKLCNMDTPETYAHSRVCDGSLEQGLSLCDDVLDIIGPWRPRLWNWATQVRDAGKGHMVSLLASVPDHMQVDRPPLHSRWAQHLAARFASADLDRAFDLKLDAGRSGSRTFRQCLHLSSFSQGDGALISTQAEHGPVALMPSDPGQAELVRLSILVLLRARDQSPGMWDTELVCDWASLSPVMPHWISLAHSSGDHHLGSRGLPHTNDLTSNMDDTTSGHLIHSCYRLVVRLMGRSHTDLERLVAAVGRLVRHCDLINRPLELLVVLSQTTPSCLVPQNRFPSLQLSGSAAAGPVTVNLLRNQASAGLPVLGHALLPALTQPPHSLPRLDCPDRVCVGKGRPAKKWFNRDPGQFCMSPANPALSSLDGVPFQPDELTPCDQASLRWCRGEDIPRPFRFINPWCPSLFAGLPLSDRPRGAPARRIAVCARSSGHSNSLIPVAGPMGVLPPRSAVLLPLAWKSNIPDLRAPGSCLPARGAEIEEMSHLIRMALARGSMSLWLDRCARMSAWWRGAASEANLCYLLGSAAESAARRKRVAEAALRSKWDALRAARSAAARPDSWSCHRSRSSRLRSDPAQRVVEGFSSEETAQERMLWAAGDPANKRRLDRSFMPWY
jgi:hypothetical protein